jgi:hypothetical protein
MPPSGYTRRYRPAPTTKGDTELTVNWVPCNLLIAWAAPETASN